VSDQLQLFRPNPRPYPRPGTCASIVVGRDGRGEIVVVANNARVAVEQVRQKTIPCSVESLNRAIRTGEQYLGLRWSRERRKRP
jgi:hypothetical protein